MHEVKRIVIPAENVGSLCWWGDSLVDWVGGGARYDLDGTVHHRSIYYPYRFDRAVMTRDGVYAVIFEALGTKGLVLKHGEMVREINRSYYWANDYEYPIALVDEPSGQTCLIHCPQSYNRIEIEDIETGACISSRQTESGDFFHSRLQVSPDGRYMSAGWIWHPFDTVLVYDLTKALKNPETFDGFGTERDFNFMGWGTEISAAAFMDAEHIVMTSMKKFDTSEERDEQTGERLQPNSIGVYNLREHRFVSKVKLEETADTLMPVGSYTVEFYKHPKLIDNDTGRVLFQWHELQTGKQNSSIIRNIEVLPPIAMDSKNRRFAVANNNTITVIQLGD